MKVGILVPSLYMYAGAFKKRISAPMQLSLQLADTLVENGVDTYYFSAPNIPTKAKVISPANHDLLSKDLRIDYQQDIPHEAYDIVSFYEKKKYFELEVTKLAYAWAMQEPDSLIHVYHAVGNLAHFFTELCPVPTLYTLHVYPPPAGTLEHWRYQRFAKQQFLPISESQKKGFLSFVPGMNMLKTIYHGVDPKVYEFSEKGGEYLAFMGRLIPEKGLDQALESAIKTNHHLEIATHVTPVTEETPYYHEKIAPFLKNPLVTMRGLLTDGPKISFLKGAKAFLFPLRWDEPFGMSVIESLAVGTPVIAYARGSMPEIILDGKVGFLVNPSPQDKKGDFIIKKTGEEGIREAIERLYALSPEEYLRMRQNARDHVLGHFTVERMVNNHMEVYTQVLSRARKRYFA
ncbi:MAG TPA: glycosyltransferase [Patescibacteria group bacterium]|nr:glycosyltransferase [Patescibacteria group bacterium]